MEDTGRLTGKVSISAPSSMTALFCLFGASRKQEHSGLKAGSQFAMDEVWELRVMLQHVRFGTSTTDTRTQPDREAGTSSARSLRVNVVVERAFTLIELLVRMRTNDFYAIAGGRVADLVNGGTKWKNIPASALPNRLWWNPNNNGHPNN